MLVILLVITLIGETIQYSHHDLGIVGGRIIHIEFAPYMVSLRQNGYYVCGGSIIHNKFVMTSALCIRKNAIDTINAGTNDINNIEEEFGIKNLHYNRYHSMPENDIALIEMFESFKFGAKINKVDLPEADLDIAVGTQVNITGWGSTSTYINKYSRILRQTMAEVVERYKCPSKSGNDITIYQFCSKSYGRGSCKGDEGGPVTVNGVQVGIISKKVDDNCVGHWSNTNVAMHISWIKNIIGSHA